MAKTKKIVRREWTKDDVRQMKAMAKAKAGESAQPPQARADYRQAWRYYGFARWPVDNSPGKNNPDARNWVGSGQRTIDEMGFAWITWYDMNDDEYKAELDARKPAKKATTTASQPQ